MTKQTDCPNCGYPDTKNGQHFKGIHDPYVNCPVCNYLVTPAVGVTPLDTVEQAVEKTKKFIAEQLREQLKGLVGAMGTDEARQKVEAAIRAVLAGFSDAGLLPTFEVTVRQEGDKTVLTGTVRELMKPRFVSEGGFGLLGEQDVKDITGVDPAKPGSEYTIVSEGHFDEDWQLILISQKVTYPEGGPIVAEDVAVAFEKVEASEKNAKRVMGVLAAFDEEDKKP